MFYLFGDVVIPERSVRRPFPRLIVCIVRLSRLRVGTGGGPRFSAAGVCRVCMRPGISQGMAFYRPTGMFSGSISVRLSGL